MAVGFGYESVCNMLTVSGCNVTDAIQSNPYRL